MCAPKCFIFTDTYLAVYLSKVPIKLISQQNCTDGEERGPLLCLPSNPLGEMRNNDFLPCHCPVGRATPCTIPILNRLTMPPEWKHYNNGAIGTAGAASVTERPPPRAYPTPTPSPGRQAPSLSQASPLQHRRNNLTGVDVS